MTTISNRRLVSWLLNRQRQVQRGQGERREAAAADQQAGGDQRLPCGRRRVWKAEVRLMDEKNFATLWYSGHVDVVGLQRWVRKRKASPDLSFNSTVYYWLSCLTVLSEPFGSPPVPCNRIWTIIWSFMWCFHWQKSSFKALISYLLLNSSYSSTPTKPLCIFSLINDSMSTITHRSAVASAN